MFFWLSKIFWMLASPLNALWILLAGALVFSWWKPLCAGRGMKLSVVVFLILGFFPVGGNLVTLLERQYPKADINLPAPEDVEGVIVLGGAFNSYLSQETGQLSPNNNISRIIGFVELAERYPRAKLVFSGGSGHVLQPDRKEADDARTFFDVMGWRMVDKVIFESNSRTTYENIANSMALLNPNTQKKWIIVSSAFHLPRVMGVCAQAGWDNVIPYAAGVKTDGRYRFFPATFNVLGNYHLLAVAVKEFIGTFIYFITGKSALPLPLSSLQSLENQRIPQQ